MKADVDNLAPTDSSGRDRASGDGGTQQMSDLEMTKLCAEAMGIKCRVVDDCYIEAQVEPTYWIGYAPLMNDEQAMALVKRFGLSPMVVHYDSKGKIWSVSDIDGNCHGGLHDDDLNRAIVECVAKMRATSA